MTTDTRTPHTTVVHDIPPAPARSWGVVMFLLPVILVVVALLPLGPSETSKYDATPAGGTNLTTGAPTVDDAWLDAPHGVPTGEAAPLRVTLVNTTHQPGLALTGVTSPAIRGAVLRQSGRDVHAIRLPPDGNAVDLEWRGPSGITLLGLHHSLRAGSYLPVTLHYSNGTSQSLQVVAGPLGPGLDSQPT